MWLAISMDLGLQSPVAGEGAVGIGVWVVGLVVLTLRVGPRLVVGARYFDGGAAGAGYGLLIEGIVNPVRCRGVARVHVLGFGCVVGCVPGLRGCLVFLVLLCPQRLVVLELHLARGHDLAASFIVGMAVCV